MDAKRLIIMRGIVSCGKSTRAKELQGSEGVIYSTDEYWYKVNFPDKPEEYSFKKRLLGEAHKWNELRAQRSIDMGHPLIIIDNTNITADRFCCPYVRYAHYQGYEVSFEEPTSPWWLEIRELLKRKRDNEEKLKAWAVELAKKSESTHNVPFWAIEGMMWRWENHITPESVLESCIQNHPIL